MAPKKKDGGGDKEVSIPKPPTPQQNEIKSSTPSQIQAAQNAVNTKNIQTIQNQVAAAQTALNKGNVDQAKNLMNTLPSYTTVAAGGQARTQLQAAAAAVLGNIDKFKPSIPPSFPVPTESTTVYFAPPSFAPPPPAPVLPVFVPVNTTNFIIKQAPLDTIVFDDTQVDVALLQDLLYEDIAGIELANISREDLIDGQQVSYSPIVNLPTIKRNYNPNNLIASNVVGQTVFSRFAIDLILRGMNDPYIDSDGNLVIEIDTVGADENIEVQILSGGTINKVDI